MLHLLQKTYLVPSHQDQRNARKAQLLLGACLKHPVSLLENIQMFHVYSTPAWKHWLFAEEIQKWLCNECISFNIWGLPSSWLMLNPSWHRKLTHSTGVKSLFPMTYATFPKSFCLLTHWDAMYTKLFCPLAPG